MGPPVRQRYNSKARQSTLGGSSHKKRRRSTNAPSNVETEYASDSAPAPLDMIMPGQREAEREQRMAALRQELVDQGEQLSSKKRKRLDAFIVSHS
jgi:ATP-dependent RNA helicase DHX37/DHR1